MISAKINGIKGNYIFQEDLRKEFLEYLSVRKKYWLLPINLVLVLFGA